MTDYPTERISAAGHAFGALYELARYLRGEHGCPWDRAQDLKGMQKCLREEVAELDDAIDADSAGELEEEWGDVLFMLLMIAVIGGEEGRFNLENALRAIEAKMVRRHPHVFGGRKADAVEKIIGQWEKIKAEEKRKAPESLMDTGRAFYSALKRADHVQRTAAGIGFDWPDSRGPLEKIEEEVGELKQAFASGDTRETGAELGDLIFSCVNLARFSGIDAESLLGGTIDKFVERFKNIESAHRRAGKSPAEASLAEMDALWEKSKTEENRPE